MIFIVRKDGEWQIYEKPIDGEEILEEMQGILKNGNCFTSFPDLQTALKRWEKEETTRKKALMEYLERLKQKTTEEQLEDEQEMQEQKHLSKIAAQNRKEYWESKWGKY